MPSPLVSRKRCGMLSPWMHWKISTAIGPKVPQATSWTWSSALMPKCWRNLTSKLGPGRRKRLNGPAPRVSYRDKAFSRSRTTSPTWVRFVQGEPCCMLFAQRVTHGDTVCAWGKEGFQIPDEKGCDARGDRFIGEILSPDGYAIATVRRAPAHQ